MAKILYTTAAVLVLSCVIFATTNALNCYSCNNLVEGFENCGDEFNNTNILNQTCFEGQDDVCFKIKGNIVDGDKAVMRGCAANYPTFCDTVAKKQNITQDGKNDIVVEDIKCYTCKGDNCNSANGVAAPVMAFLGVAALVRTLTY